MAASRSKAAFVSIALHVAEVPVAVVTTSGEAAMPLSWLAWLIPLSEPLVHSGESRRQN
jgi:hypothetical protein